MFEIQKEKDEWKHNDILFPSVIQFCSQFLVVRTHRVQIGVATLLVIKVLIIEVDRVPTSQYVVHYNTAERVSKDGHFSSVWLKTRVTGTEYRVQATHLCVETFNNLKKGILQSFLCICIIVKRETLPLYTIVTPHGETRKKSMNPNFRPMGCNTALLGFLLIIVLGCLFQNFLQTKLLKLI